MSECFLCHTALEPVNDAELEGVELCVDCCENIDTVIRDYILSSPGGLDLRDALKDVVREVVSEK
jgi:hypothetical protein